MEIGTWLVLLFAIVSSFKIPLQRVRSSPRRLGSMGATALNNYDNVLVPQVQYYANITVGTPGQSLSALFDTGSSLSWVPSITCDTTCGASKYYDSSKSTSYTNLGITKNLVYGLGSSSGSMGTETFSVGKSSSVSATSVPFLLVTSETDSSGSEFDGLIVTITQGFGFSALSDNYPTFVDTLKTQNVINARIFSFYLGNDNWGLNGYDTSSVCLIGEVDLSYASGTVIYMPLYRQQGYWSVQMSAAKMGTTPITLSNDTAILDTGTSGIVIPKSDASSFLAGLNAVGACSFDTESNIVCDCHQSYVISNYPSLVIELNHGANSYTLTPSQYLYDVRFTQDGKECISLVEDGGNIPFWDLGDVFLRNRYMIFDMDNLQVGIAASAGNNSPSPTSSTSSNSTSPSAPSTNSTSTSTSGTSTNSTSNSTSTPTGSTTTTGGSLPVPVNNTSAGATTSGNGLGLVLTAVLTSIVT